MGRRLQMRLIATLAGIILFAASTFFTGAHKT